MIGRFSVIASRPIGIGKTKKIKSVRDLNTHRGSARGFPDGRSQGLDSLAPVVRHEKRCRRRSLERSENKLRARSQRRGNSESSLWWDKPSSKFRSWRCVNDGRGTPWVQQESCDTRVCEPLLCCCASTRCVFPSFPIPHAPGAPEFLLP